MAMKMRMIPTVLVATLAVLVVAGLSHRTEAAGGRTAWEGIYTEAQAARGTQVLTEQCVLCHGETMKGGGGVPSAAGPEFMFNWNGKPVSELFTYLKTMMPPTAPGSLSDQKYADAMAAVLKHNGFPAGESAEIPADATVMTDVIITAAKP